MDATKGSKVKIEGSLCFTQQAVKGVFQGGVRPAHLEDHIRGPLDVFLAPGEIPIFRGCVEDIAAVDDLVA